MNLASYVKVMSLVFLFVLPSISLFQTATVGALEVGGNDVRYIANGTFEFRENIVIEGNATLIVENATVKFIQTSDNQYGIILRNPSGGTPRLIARNASFDSPRRFKVSLWGNSTADFIGLTFKGSVYSSVEPHDKSTLNVRDGSLVNYVNTYGSSKLNAIGSNVFFPNSYDNSNMTISTCTVNNMKASGNSSAYISVSTVKYSVTAESSSFVSVSNCYVSGEIVSRKTSRVLFVEDTLCQIKVKSYEYSNVTIIDAIFSASKFSGDFSIRDFSYLYIYSSIISDTFFKVYNNATMKIEGSNLTSSVFYSYNGSKVEVVDSALDWIFESYDVSNLIASYSSFNVLSVEESSNVALDHCEVALLRAYESANLSVSDSTVTEILIELLSVNVNLSGFGEGFFKSIAFGVSGLNVTLSDSTVSAGWSFRFLGSSNVTFRDSRLLVVDVFDSGRVQLWNCTYASLTAVDVSEVRVWSYLSVRVVDYFGNPVEGAQVTVTLDNAVVDSKQSDVDGLAVFDLFERIVNASGDTSAGNYAISIAFGDQSVDSNVNLAGSQMLVSTIASPWWYWYLIWGLVGVAVIVGVAGTFLIIRRKRKSKVQS